jgi:predicted nucleotidyltransferase
MERTRKVDIGNVSVKYAALEDVIIHKMIAGRPRDLEDVRLMLEKNPDADFQYLILWLSEFERELGVPYLEELDKRKPQEK